MVHEFTGFLKELIDLARRGTARDVDAIMVHLTRKSSLAMTRFVDFALSQVRTPEGKDRIAHYLFHGSRIQRNYASLYLNRDGEWKLVKQAFEQGLIDEIQAFAR
ncbi:MAG: hypothetical protein R2751_02870 [Bacteroidales bacterium]